MNEFEMKDIGHATKILGMNIVRNREEGTVEINQTEYHQKIVRKFNLDNAKSVSVPLAQHFRLSKEQSPENDEERIEMLKIPYSNAVGSLMYSMTCTRPDLAFAMSVISQYMSDPGKSHWEAVKWVIRYLKGS